MPKQAKADEDGEEDEKKKEKASADDTDDRRNPQYIPRKGMFYEHDDREAIKLEKKIGSSFGL